MVRFLVACSTPLLAAGAQVPLATETIRTRVPQAHVDAFMKDCAQKSPLASCWCVVRKMNETADGQFSLDISGMLEAKPEAAKADFLDAMNRHGLRASQAKTVIDRTQPLIAAAVKDCD